MFPVSWGPFYFSVSSSWMLPGHNMAASPSASPTALSRMTEEATRSGAGAWPRYTKRANCCKKSLDEHYLCLIIRNSVTWSLMAVGRLGDTVSWLSTRPPCTRGAQPWGWRGGVDVGRGPGAAALPRQSVSPPRRVLCCFPVPRKLLPSTPSPAHSNTDRLLIFQRTSLLPFLPPFSRAWSASPFPMFLRVFICPCWTAAALSCGSLSWPSDLYRLTW